MKPNQPSLLCLILLITASGCGTLKTSLTKMDSSEIDVIIEEHILTKNPCYTAGRKIEVKGIMLHSVGCPVPSGETWVKLWNREDYNRACVHAFIDAHTAVVWQTLPWNHRGWHAGGQANNTHIGVEMCEPECLKYTGGATFTTSDLEASRAMARRTYVAAINLFAYLCHIYHLNPLAKESSSPTAKVTPRESPPDIRTRNTSGVNWTSPTPWTPSARRSLKNSRNIERDQRWRGRPRPRTEWLPPQVVTASCHCN